MSEENGTALPAPANRPGTATVAWGSVGSFGPTRPGGSHELFDQTLAAPSSGGDPVSFAETLLQPSAPTSALDQTQVAPSGTNLQPLTDSLTRTLVRSTVLPRVEMAGSSARLVHQDRTRYEHEHLLGQGGVGEVVRVKDHDIDRTVAVKRLRSDMREAGSVARFVDEIRTIGQLEHPNIVPIHDVGVDEEGQLFFVMKYVEGETLESVIEKLAAGDVAYLRRYTHERRVEIFLGILEAVHYAHARGIIHRDIKPANVMVGPFGEVMVMDWGLAKRISGADQLALLPADEAASPVGDTGRDLFRTRAGTLLGTPAYMSPEQARAQKDIDERSDIYSLCVMFHELLGLQHYLADQTTLASMLVAVQEQRAKNVSFIAHPHQHSPAADLGHFVAKGLHKNPADRYRSVEQMIARLRDRAAGEIPIECPVTGMMSVGHRAIRVIERYPIATIVMLSLFVIGSLVAAAYAGARLLHV